MIFVFGLFTPIALAYLRRRAAAVATFTATAWFPADQVPADHAVHRQPPG